MKILFVSWIFPYPPDFGAKKRIFNIIRAFCKTKSEIDLLTFCDQNDLKFLENLRPYVKKIYTCDKNCMKFFALKKYIYHHSFFVRFFYHISSLQPSIFREFSSKDFRKLFISANPKNYNLIWIERLFLAHMFSDYADRIIVDLDDIEHIKKYRFIKSQSFYFSLILEFLDYLKLKFYEKRTPQKYFKVVVCSDIDKKYLGNQKNIHVVPNIVEIPSTYNLEIEEDSNLILFFGTMHYHPNEDAIFYFVKEIFPYVKKYNSKAKLVIAGGHPGPKIRSLNNNSDIFVTGYVNKIEDYIKKAGVIIVPLRIGGGTRIKILEALSYQKAVVSTSIGAEGLHVQHGKHLLIANDPISFAEAIINLQHNHQLRKELGKSGRELVIKRYSFKTLVDAIRQIVS